MSKESYHTILELLNQNAIDLSVYYDLIEVNMEKYSDFLQSIEINENLESLLGVLAISISQTKALNNFWSLIRALSGGIQFQELQNRILDKNGHLRINLNDIGLKILQKKHSKPLIRIKSAISISKDAWNDIIDLLQSDDIFLHLAKQAKFHENQKYETQLKSELHSILTDHPELTKDEREKFSIAYRKTRININDFLKEKSQSKSTPPPIRPKPSENNDTIPDFDNYQAYLEADERELARMKRTGDYLVKKRGKNRKRRKEN